MRDFVRNHRTLTALVSIATCLVLGALLWSLSAPVRGQLVARFDTAREHYELLGYGLPGPGRAEYARLLRERYGIEYRPVALCIVSPTVVAYVDNYNGVSTAAANRKFGHDVFKECAEEARKKLAGGQSATGPLDRIRAKTAVDLVTNLASTQIAGQYVHPSKELVKLVGPPLGGKRLYIFPDKTYVYCKWADVSPNTVYDRGIWSFDGGVLELKSDPEIVWYPQLERQFLAVRRPSHKGEILLMGLEDSVPYFEEHAGDDPTLMLLIVALPKEEAVSLATTARLKATLMREAWRPDYFRK
jgi:hypothetical protein